MGGHESQMIGQKCDLPYEKPSSCIPVSQVLSWRKYTERGRDVMIPADYGKKRDTNARDDTSQARRPDSNPSLPSVIYRL